MCIVRRAMYFVLRAMYFVLRAMYFVLRAMYSVQCTAYFVQCTSCSVLRAVCIVLRAVYFVQCAVFSVYCTSCSVHCSKLGPKNVGFIEYFYIVLVKHCTIGSKCRLYRILLYSVSTVLKKSRINGRLNG